MDSQLHVVQGRKVIAVDGDELRRAARSSRRVVVDLGTGDGRWIYRMARANPSWCCIGVDANAASMRETSKRAMRKIERGGASNAWFILAAVERLPDALSSIADEVYVQYPWGSLRQMLLDADERRLQGLARIGKPRAAFHFTVNLLTEDSQQHAHIPGQYARAGLEVRRLKVLYLSPGTSWGNRIGQGAPVPVLAVDGKVRSSEPKLIMGRNPYDGHRESAGTDA